MDANLRGHFVAKRTQRVFDRQCDQDALLKARWMQMGAGDRSLNYYELNVLTQENLVPRDLCLLAGMQIQISDYGILGYAMKSAQTLSQALHLASKYRQTAVPLMNVNFALEGDLYAVILENTSGLAQGMFSLLVEELMATFPRVIYQLTGEEILARKVELSYPNPGHMHSYQKIFSCLPNFDANRCVFAFSAKALALPLLAKDANMLELLDRRCQDLLDFAGVTKGLSHNVTRLLLQQLSSVNSANDICSLLNISERTLRRNLAKENTSFQALLDDVRQRFAEDCLRTTTLSVQEVAELVGYTEASNFRRAFHRWTGRTPDNFRMHAQPAQRYASSLTA
ncbi:MAG: AraC-like DNA-binding protein [Candidatus Azotimanducaceae bacterium]